MLLGILALACSLSAALSSDVLDLGDGDFDYKVKESGDVVLVEFFAPWCGHCKKLAPHYEEAATILKSNDPPVPLAKVDCTEAGKETCSKYGVSGYPTLKIFRHGEFSQEYSGPREAQGIVKFMRAQVGPSSKQLDSIEQVQAFIDKDEVGILGYFSSAESELKVTFLKVADKLRESHRFGHTVSDAVSNHFNHRDVVVLYRAAHLKNKFEPSEVEYTDSASSDKALQEFIKKSANGLVGLRSGDNAASINTPYIVAYYKVDYLKNPKGTNYWRNRLLKVVVDFAETDVTFAFSDKDEFTQELNEYGFDFVSGDKPVVVARNKDNQKFVMKGEFTPESYKEFIQSFIDGKLEPYMKSEPVPASNDEPVKVAVARNFEELVTKSNKDVLVEFYAPWCGHCKKLTPIFEELGTALADEPEVAIVKMDATANDVPASFQVQGFPTLYWINKGQPDSPKRYEGGRELKDFLSYIAEHSTNELRGYDRKGNKKDKTEL